MLMEQIKERKQSQVYFDVSAGRGPYDAGYESEEEIFNQFINKKAAETENSKKPSHNDFHTGFKNFNDLNTKKLEHSNFNSIQAQRRHSTTRAPSRGRAGGRNYSRQQNYPYDNNKRYFYNNNNNKSYLSDTPETTFNWSPNNFSKN